MAEPVLTPGDWLKFLNKKLDAQALAVRTPTDYYNGIQKLSFATAKFKEAFSRYFPPMANNWMKLVVDSPVSRLHVEGFRFDPDPFKAGWDQEADHDAWEIWQQNNLDALSVIVHTEAIKCGVCNVLVAPGASGEPPLITPEHPAQSYVQCSYSDRRKRLAAIKRFVDEFDGFGYAFVYLPDWIHVFKTSSKMNPGQPWSDTQWTRPIGQEPVIRNTLGVVPMVAIENNPDLMYGGRSDLEVAIPIQDAINKLCLDMQVSSEYHAFPQRWASGWETATDAKGRPIPGDQLEVKLGQTRLVRANSPDTKFGSFEPGEVDNYIKPIELYIDHLAAVTQTPTYYLKGQMVNMSADALRAADAGFVDRIDHKLPFLGDGWEEVMRVAFLAKKDTKRGKAKMVETIWRSPETQALGVMIDAGVKMRQSLSVPVEMVWEMMGWSQQKIAMAKQMMGLPDTPAERRKLDASNPASPAYKAPGQAGTLAERSSGVKGQPKPSTRGSQSTTSRSQG